MNWCMTSKLGLLILLALHACVEIEPLPFVQLDAADIDENTFRSIKVSGSLNGTETFEVEAAGFAYSSTNPTPLAESTDAELVLANKNEFGFDRNFSAIIENLTVPPHQYHIRAFIKYDGTYVYSPTSETIRFNDGWQSSQKMNEPLWSFMAETLEGKIYFGVGCPESNCKSNSNSLNFWAFDHEAETVEKATSFPGPYRQFGISFVLQNAIYFGLGSIDNSTTYFSDLWKYQQDDAGGTWTLMEDFPGGKRESASAFVLGDAVYIGLGRDKDSIYNDFYRFDGTHWIALDAGSGTDLSGLRRY
ncbi:MAG: hypothetical protein OEQ53_21475, partial [Saprospiraceae bacterium]|nr:hypothetical protein [Saprospiraceae bacterium]